MPVFLYFHFYIFQGEIFKFSLKMENKRTIVYSPF